MEQSIHDMILAVLLFPLLGALIAGLFGKVIGQRASHWVTILGIAVAFVFSVYLFYVMVIQGAAAYNTVFYTWVASGSFQFDVGVLVDRLSVLMMVTVTFVSLLVHIYSIGYMKGDSGYQRFFSYMSLFTFFMLVLVAGNNFFMLFFGWEGVGLVSYLLISFWFKRDSAASGGLKAFVVNRVGDFGFLLGIAAIMDYFGTVNYAAVFAKAPELVGTTISILPGEPWMVLTVICILLFIGAMGKSAQIPLHVWLPESMEGPTPISALIHAATMVTAGIYMVARMSPLYELSEVAQSTVLIFGSTGALLLGLVGIVQFDIKRVIAYSTMSQLGYMMAANGVSAFAGGMFHLVTHAGFKALLFLGAGSVIIAMHHEQDMRKMGNLRKYMPITYITFLVGGLALSAIPLFSGFYSKDAVIEVVGFSTIPGATYAYWCLVVGAFVTALYTFRAFFMTFHGTERIEEKHKGHVHESKPVVTIPLILLAIPSVFLGMIMVEPMLVNEPGLLGNTVFVAEKYDVLKEFAHHFHGVFAAIWGAIFTVPFWFAISGIIVAWYSYVKNPAFPEKAANFAPRLYKLLLNKFGFDSFNELVFERGGMRLSNFFYKVTDSKVIDGYVVNGSGRNVERLSQLLRHLQTGYLYHYAFVMILGLFGFLVWMLLA